MGLGISMRFSTEIKHKLRLTQSQKLLLEQILRIKLELKHPDIPNAAKGLEGLEISDRILKSRGAIGLLIGGLAEEVWNKDATEASLVGHKDVDVMVTAESKFKPAKPFEGGIDWWIPQTERISVIDEYANESDRNVTYWTNGNGVTLKFGIEQNNKLSPGLYIPHGDLITSIKLAEVSASRDFNEIEGADCALDSFARKTRKGIGRKLMPTIKKSFQRQILEKTKRASIDIQEFDFWTALALEKK